MKEEQNNKEFYMAQRKMQDELRAHKENALNATLQELLNANINLKTQINMMQKELVEGDKQKEELKKEIQCLQFKISVAKVEENFSSETKGEESETSETKPVNADPV